MKCISNALIASTGGVSLPATTSLLRFLERHRVHGLAEARRLTVQLQRRYERRSASVCRRLVATWCDRASTAGNVTSQEVEAQ